MRMYSRDSIQVPPRKQIVVLRTSCTRSSSTGERSRVLWWIVTGCAMPFWNCFSATNPVNFDCLRIPFAIADCSFLNLECRVDHSHKVSKGWLYGFCLRYGITSQAKTDKKYKSVHERLFLIEQFHKLVFGIQNAFPQVYVYMRAIHPHASFHPSIHPIHPSIHPSIL